MTRFYSGPSMISVCNHEAVMHECMICSERLFFISFCNCVDRKDRFDEQNTAHNFIENLNCVLSRCDLESEQFSYDTIIVLRLLIFFVFREKKLRINWGISCNFTHERKLIETHEEFRSRVVRDVSQLTTSKSNCIANDKETTIISANLQYLPEIYELRC